MMTTAKKFKANPEDKSYLAEHYYIVYSRKSSCHFRFVQNTSEIVTVDETTEPSVIRPTKRKHSIRSLCANCNALSFDVKDPEYFRRWRINLGFLAIIVSTKRCSLCNAIAELLPLGIRIRICNTMDQKESRLQVYLAATSSRPVDYRAPWSFRVGIWSCDPCRRLSGIIGDDWSGSTGHYSHLDYTGNYRHFGLLRVRIKTPLDTTIASGPPLDLSIIDLPDYCDLQFVERVMSRCVNEHSELCSIPRHTELADDKNQPNQPEGLRTIDVVTMQLVDHPPNTDYVALSYNWDHSGGSHSNFTSTSNIESLRAPHGLLSLEFPQTVTDAIYVCQKSNFRYLWVDSICIIQDSYEDKALQICRMDQIYGAASVAIVVACGTDPSKGITTLRERSPGQIKISLGELDLITTEPPLENALRNSLWNTRGWTFQELMLPRRLIVFTSSQTYFVCAKGVVAEDTVDGHAYDIVYDNKIRRDPFAIWTMLSTAGRSSQQRTNWDVYRHAVTSYTHRTLTFASDRLAAISGVLGALGSFTKDTFICGLPAKVFPGALIWYSTGAASRCVEFPSWSWAGWLGELTYPGRSELPLGPIASGGRVERVASHLKDIRFCNNDGVDVPIFQYVNEYSGMGQAPLPVRWFKHFNQQENCWAHEIDSKISLTNIQHGLLRFRARCTCLSIAPNLTVMSPYQKVPELWPYRILRMDSWIGTVFLDNDTHLRFKQRTSMCEFIAIMTDNMFPSNIEQRVLYGLPILQKFSQLPTWIDRKGNARGDMFRNSKGHPMIFDPAYFETSSTYTRAGDKEIQITYAMWIERRNGICYRKGMGFIATDANVDWTEDNFILG